MGAVGTAAGSAAGPSGTGTGLGASKGGGGGDGKTKAAAVAPVAVAAGGAAAAKGTPNDGAAAAAPSGVPVTVSVTIAHFQEAPAAEIAAAEARALSPVRMQKAFSSPLIEQYARATHTLNAEIWLFNPTTVANEIVLPIERLEELRTMLAPQGFAVNIPADNSLPTVTYAPSAPLDPAAAGAANAAIAALKMYNLYTVPQLLDKFAKDGEVGRGRNKTALNNAKQVARAVATELKGVVGA